MNLLPSIFPVLLMAALVASRSHAQAFLAPPARLERVPVQQREAPMKTRPLSHWLLLFTIVVLWGSAFGFTELAIEAFTPIVLVTGRMILAAGLLTLVVLMRGQRFPRSGRFW
ncbi:MAG: hypothetical protein ACR2P3_15395, partial [Geminicoccaceae bacterium]